MSWEFLAVSMLLIGVLLGLRGRPRSEPARVIYLEREQPEQGGGCLPLAMFVVGLLVALMLFRQWVP